MRTALVAIDYSEVSRALISFAFRFAQDDGIERLDFIHVVDFIRNMKDACIEGAAPRRISLENLRANAERLCERTIRKIAEREEASSLFAELFVEFGAPASKILDRLEEKRYEMLLIGHRSLSTSQRFLMGSVALRVLAHAPCRVLVFRQGALEVIEDAERREKR